MSVEIRLFESEEEREDRKIKEYKEYLIEKGFRVEDPPESYKFNITTLVELVNFFYQKMSRKYPDLKQIKRNFGRDRAIAKRFVDSRMESGINRLRALNEAAELIEILFKYEEDFKFKYPVQSIGILGQKNLRWVTDKLERKWIEDKAREKARKLRTFNEQLEKAQETELKINQDSHEAELEKILEEMDNHYGED